MTFRDTKFPIKARTNDDFSMHIDTGFDITGTTPKFSIEKRDGTIIDLSQYCSIVTGTSFLVSIKADILEATVGALMADYDFIIDKGNGSKEFLFSGKITIDEGVSI